MYLSFLLAFIITSLLSATLTLLVKHLAVKKKVLDYLEPQTIFRKIHKKPIPLLGGVAVIFSFNIVLTFFYFTLPLLSENINLKSMAAIWLGSLVLLVGGVLDDIYNLKPSKQVLFPVLSALIIVGFGIGIIHLTNPFGGKIPLSGPTIAGVGLVSGLFVFIWVVGMIYTTKFLDGLDGLASGIGLVGSLVIFALSLTPDVNQSYTALISLIAAGSFLGFLIFNWHPAKIFLGESGSVFIGFILAILAIISGGKIATAFLVMGIPILDAAWVIGRRLFSKKSPFVGDRQHLHFRLLDLGLNQSHAVLVLILLSSIFGFLALTLQSMGKFLTLLFMIIVMIIMSLWLLYEDKKKVL